MTWIIFILAGFAVGYWLGRRSAPAEQKHSEVLHLFRDGREVVNDEVQKALGVSDATATRYLDALEKSGDIVQIGSTGRGVVYRKK